MKKLSFRRLSVSTFTVFAIVFLIAAIRAQQNAPPLHSDGNTLTQASSPILITPDDAKTISRDRTALAYSIRNQSEKFIRSIVISGIPGTMHTMLLFGGSLAPGDVHSISIGNTKPKNVAEVSVVAADFVLFNDGTTWGSDTAGKADYVIGFYEGQKNSYFDVKRLVEQGDESSLIRWLKSKENQTAPPGVESNPGAEWRRGYISGYRQNFDAIRHDYKNRGIEVVPLHIERVRYSLSLPL